VKRATVLGVAFAAAMGASAAGQQSSRIYRVGVLGGSADVVYKDGFARDLAGFGYRDGQNLELVFRSIGGDYSRARTLANEMVRGKPDVIVGSNSPMVAALARATASIPIVMIHVADPVGVGFVRSLARPGGNITGVTTITAGLAGKRLQLLTELVPHVRRVVFIESSGSPGNLIEAEQFRAACRRLQIECITMDIRSAGEIDSVLRGLRRRHPDVLAVATNAALGGSARRIVELIAAQRLPAMYDSSEFPTAGGLVSYGFSTLGQWALTATYVDRILKGAKPADLPVQQPTTFDLVVNLKTAHALGLTVPQSILLQATQVIR